jgi:Invasion associated locus B (IalB) protein
MNVRTSFILPLVTALAVLPAAAWAQAPAPKQKPGTASSPPQVKPSQQAPAAGAGQKPGAAAKNAPTPAKTTPTNQPTLIGQYDNWGAYWAAPDGRKVCFAAARPQQSNRGRTPAYLFITSRPHEKVKDEISVITSFPLKANADATAVIGGKQYMMSTQSDGVWIKNQTDETKLVDAMRKGGDLVLKATTDRGLASTDTFSMKGLSQALDRISRECK